MLKDVADSLYIERPVDTLFHYTSLHGLIGICEHKSLWATEIRYLNDDREFIHFPKIMEADISARLGMANEETSIILNQLSRWLKDWFIDGSMIFTTSFTGNGNLLSQWRGYCPHGQGVSLGFDPTILTAEVSGASFEIGKCLYNPRDQQDLAIKVVQEIIDLARSRGENSKRHTSESYYPCFEELSGDIIRIASLMKHHSFSEENEWRCISQPVTHYGATDIKYRVGKSSLLPYILLPLPVINGAVVMTEIIVGPSPTPNLAMDSVVKYLARNANTGLPRRVRNCGIPYRA